MKTRICNNCGIEKSLSEYHKKKGGKYGTSAVCKVCKNLQNKKWRKETGYHKKYYTDNKDKLLEQQKQHYNNNFEYISAKHKEYYLANKESIDECRKQWRKDNREYLLIEKRKDYLKNKSYYYEKQKQWRIDNREKHNAYNRRWASENKNKKKQYYIKNKEKVAKYIKQYQIDNKDKINAINAKRRATKLKQTPNLTPEELKTIQLYYKLSTALRPNFQVDHIQPLSGGGLHCPTNLQILHKYDNLSKGPKTDYVYEHPRYRIHDGQLTKTS